MSTGSARPCPGPRVRPGALKRPAGVSAEGRHSVATGLLAKVRSDRGLGAPYVYSFTTKALRASGYPSVEAMREVIASRFTPAELAAIANAFEKDTERLTRGVRNGRRREVDFASELPEPLTAEAAR